MINWCRRMHLDSWKSPSDLLADGTLAYESKRTQDWLMEALAPLIVTFFAILCWAKTVKFHFVTIKHVVMFFKLQFSYQQLVFIFKIVKTLVPISQSYPAI
jgi:hypothetical protein